MQKTWRDVEEEYANHLRKGKLSSEVISNLEAESKVKDFSVICLCITVVIIFLIRRKSK